MYAVAVERTDYKVIRIILYKGDIVNGLFQGRILSVAESTDFDIALTVAIEFFSQHSIGVLSRDKTKIDFGDELSLSEAVEATYFHIIHPLKGDHT